ncbi:MULTISPECIES: SCO family protein [Ahrensia]|jgi:protein SCO1|uniref:SCO family protein n=1 Tax=Ahrensia kielensis TaxID=76980 RepID=A0ABU9T4H5_9HYPH|nr:MULTISPECIES: SCO family protein [Ahrensia]
MRILFSVLIVALVAALGVVFYQWQQTQNSVEAYGVPFELVDGQGEKITQEAFIGQPSALFFGFTHCPEICPTTLYELNGWLETLGEDGENIEAFFITVDPERDTVEILNNYVSSVTDRVTAITGDPDKVRAMASGYGIYYKRQELEDGDYTMDHTASIFLLDSNGDFRSTIAWGENSETAIQKLRNLAGS